MPKSIAEILAWVDEIVPNKVNSTTKQIFVREMLGPGSEIYKFNTELTYLTTSTVQNQNEYNLPSGVQVHDIVWMGVSNTTHNSTDVLGTTTAFTEYKYYGLEDSKVGSRYTNFSTQLSISPTPDSAYHMKIIYKPSYYTSSSDSTTVLNVSNPLLEYIQNKLAARVCKCGSFPRVDLANNYERDAQEKLDVAKTYYFSNRHRWYSKRNTSWKRWW